MIILNNVIRKSIFFLIDYPQFIQESCDTFPIASSQSRSTASSRRQRGVDAMTPINQLILNVLVQLAQCPQDDLVDILFKASQPRIMVVFALVTFTWPGPPPLRIPQRHFFEFLPARWKGFLSIWPANLAQNTVEGISPGQVNVTRIANPVILERM